jgi:phage baseplate assembly protein W
MTSAEVQRDYLGRGWKFPIQVTSAGRIATAGFEQRVEESIYLIVSTALGERVMLPDFGCAIHELVLAPGSPGVASLVAQQVRRALTAYEPRIDVLDVSPEHAREEPNLLLVRIGYRIRANNAIGNLVYPFYVTEGQ